MSDGGRWLVHKLGERTFSLSCMGPCMSATRESMSSEALHQGCDLYGPSGSMHGLFKLEPPALTPAAPKSRRPESRII